jgi:hypothetical protein
MALTVLTGVPLAAAVGVLHCLCCVVSDLTVGPAGNGPTAMPALASSGMQHAPASGPPSAHASPAVHHAAPPAAAAAEQQQPGGAAQPPPVPAAGGGGGGGSFQPSAYPASWEVPDESFASFAGDMVRHRLGKYVQPEHPSRITKEDAQQLYRWGHWSDQVYARQSCAMRQFDSSLRAAWTAAPGLATCT